MRPYQSFLHNAAVPEEAQRAFHSQNIQKDLGQNLLAARENSQDLYSEDVKKRRHELRKVFLYLEDITCQNQRKDIGSQEDFTLAQLRQPYR